MNTLGRRVSCAEDSRADGSAPSEVIDAGETLRLWEEELQSKLIN